MRILLVPIFACGLTMSSITTIAVANPSPPAVFVAVDPPSIGLADSDSARDALFRRIQRSVRDAMQRTTGGLAGAVDLLDEAGYRIPNLGMLRVDPVANSSTSGFGWRDDPFHHHRKFHSGADIRGKHGTPVVTAGDGVVVFAGQQNGYGNIVYVDHGGGVITRYAHLSKIEAKRDAKVTAGECIGKIGSTGHTTGPHLHFEVRLDGRAVDPVTAMVVAELAREAPAVGRIAAYALSPALQANKRSDPAPNTPRPERSGRTKRVRPQS